MLAALEATRRVLAVADPLRRARPASAPFLRRAQPRPSRRRVAAALRRTLPAALALAAFAPGALAVSPARAQVPPDSLAAAVAADTLAVASPSQPDSAAPQGPNTRGAFLRGVVLPGWGHTVSGATGRGAFYFGAESMAGWMLFKTWRRLAAAREQADLLERRITAQLQARGVTDPQEIEQALEQDEETARVRGLVAAREDQREDWIAPVIFIMLVSGVDAFVSAHLQEFPQPLTIEGDPSTGRVEVGFRVPVGPPTLPTRGVRGPRTRR